VYAFSSTIAEPSNSLIRRFSADRQSFVIYTDRANSINCSPKPRGWCPGHAVSDSDFLGRQVGFHLDIDYLLLIYFI
jgi:hypothetical protein